MSTIGFLFPCLFWAPVLFFSSPKVEFHVDATFDSTVLIKLLQTGFEAFCFGVGFLAQFIAAVLQLKA